PFAFSNNFNVKWATIVDSTKYGGGFNCAAVDVNGDLYSNTQVVGVMKYKNYIETTNGNDQKNFPLKLSAVDGQPILRFADVPCGTQNNSTNNVLFQNYLVDKLGNIYMSGNLSNNQVIVGTDTAKYYGGNNDMFIIKYGNVCGNNMPMIAAGTPSGLVAKCNGTAISLSWQKLNNGEDKYYIYRSLAANSGFVKIDSVQPTINTYTDANVLSKTNYWYAISSHNIVGEGYLSQTDSARLCDDTLGGFVGSVSAKNQLSVYPNPASQSIVISHLLLVNTIEVTDVLGRTQMVRQAHHDGSSIVGHAEFRTFGTSISIDVETLPNGIYFINATDINGNVMNGKFVKQ
ncbi:MAG: Secretion system C-terminal sorting domain, partial [Bacteroidota bacterium]